MSDRPTIYLANWASRRTPSCHGPGRKLTFMVRPRPKRGECGQGSVPLLTPKEQDLIDVREGEITGLEYRIRFERHIRDAAHLLTPGALLASVGGLSVPIEDGDTLYCACSTVDAAAGRCHRVWAAHALAKAGWRVVLDGEDLTS